MNTSIERVNRLNNIMLYPFSEPVHTSSEITNTIQLYNIVCINMVFKIV